MTIQILAPPLQRQRAPAIPPLAGAQPFMIRPGAAHTQLAGLNLTVAKRLALIGGFTPQRCGIATFTADIYTSLTKASPDLVIDTYAMTPEITHFDFGPEVRGAIIASDHDSFIKAAHEINSSGADAVWLQHEFGLFGGLAGDLILELVDRIAAPLIITLHTVLADPDDDQLRVMRRLIAHASKLVVMSERSRSLLVKHYGAEADQVALIPHGVPDRPFGRSAQFKAKHGFDQTKLLMTFGLLSPGKGIEAVITALPAIVAEHPDLVYCIVGATHPNLIAREGEAYRNKLCALATWLGVDRHIHWIDAFVETNELLDLIEAADIFITPYPGAAQSTSGTLAYALALGKAVISTPYAHAAELLADNHGVLVPFGDSHAIAMEIAGLLNDPQRMLALQERAYTHGRSMLWPAFAALSLAVIEEVAPPLPVEEPSRALGIDGLLRICDDTGIFQHSIHSVPDRAHGYCVDDNARALMLMNRLGDSAEPHRTRLATIFASFVQSAWNGERGEFRNFMGFARNWLEDAGSEDSCGRTLWALGATAFEGQTPGIRRWARGLYDHTAPSAFGFGSPRATAFAMLGADYILATDEKHELALRLLSHGADTLLALHKQASTLDWCWFEARLAYDNARLPEAMIRAGKRLGRSDVMECGIQSLRWINAAQTTPAGHFRPVGSNSFGREYELPRPFDQQPVEVWAAINACSAAYDVTGDAIWLAHAQRAFDWFSGANDRGVVVGDPVSGTCQDGINPRGLNLNEGAESVLAYQLSACALDAFEKKII